jgi:hypothetical protein
LGNANQVVGGDAGHDVVSMMDAPIAIVPERVGKGIGDFGRVGGTERGQVCPAATLAGVLRTEQELRSLSPTVLAVHGPAARLCYAMTGVCTNIEVVGKRSDTGGEFGVR